MYTRFIMNGSEKFSLTKYGIWERKLADVDYNIEYFSSRRSCRNFHVCSIATAGKANGEMTIISWRFITTNYNFSKRLFSGNWIIVSSIDT